MSNDWFFEKFALIANAPGAVERMRGLVLELAVQGRVVEQDNSEGSSLVLLKEIRKKNIASNEEISMEQVEFQSVTVPSSWEICGLGEVAEIVRGVTFPGSAKSDSPRDGYVACLRTASIQSEIDWEDLIYIPQSHVRRMDQWVAPNDILISMANSYELVGKVAIVRSCPKKASFGAFLAAIRPILVDPYYLLYVLRSPRMQFSFRASSSQTTNIANISLGRMRPLPFPLPPLAEQKRIVAKVDELMGLCDALESQQQERELRKSVLVRSSLSRFAEAPTPENLGYLFHKSYDIPPSELRKSILTLAVQGKLVPFDTEGTEQTVGEHIDFQNGFAFKSQWFTATGTRLCRNVNVSHGFLDWKESVSVDEKVARDFQRFALCEGDIVLSLDRPLIATGLKIARVRQEDLPSLLLQRVARLTPKHDQLSRSYIFLWLNSTAFVDCIDPGRSNGVPHISTRQVQQLAFSVPPLAEQHRIVAKVDQLMSLVDELERQQETSRENATKLLDAIVQEMTSRGRGIAATLES
jgi:type I restriction enzyme S subunit